MLDLAGYHLPEGNETPTNGIAVVQDDEKKQFTAYVLFSMEQTVSLANQLGRPGIPLLQGAVTSSLPQQTAQPLLVLNGFTATLLLQLIQTGIRSQHSVECFQIPFPSIIAIITTTEETRKLWFNGVNEQAPIFLIMCLNEKRESEVHIGWSLQDAEALMTKRAEWYVGEGMPKDRMTLFTGSLLPQTASKPATCLTGQTAELVVIGVLSMNNEQHEPCLD